MKRKTTIMILTVVLLLSGCSFKDNKKDSTTEINDASVNEVQTSEELTKEIPVEDVNTEIDVAETEVIETETKEEEEIEQKDTVENLNYEGVISIDEFINQYIEPYVTDEAIIQLQVQHDYEGSEYIQLTVAPKYENDAYSEKYLYIIHEDTSKPVEFSLPEEYAEYVPFTDVRAEEYEKDLIHIDINRANIEFSITKEANPDIGFPEKVEFGDLENAMMTLRSYVSIDNPEETGYRVLNIN